MVDILANQKKNVNHFSGKQSS